MSEKDVLATVAGIEITDSDIDAYIEKMPPEQKAYASNPYFRQQVLQQVINTNLLFKYGEENNVEESDEYKKIMADLRREVVSQLAVSRMLEGIEVTDDEARAYYAANGQQFVKGETVGAKHILVDCPGHCAQILESIKNGEKTFEDAAKEYSTCPSKAQGGDLGEFGRGQMVPEFDKAAFEAEVDDIVGPVKTQFGYHLIKVYKHTKPDVPSYEEAADQIKKEMLQEKQNAAYQHTLAGLKARYM